jgi:hypothetical protein
MLSSNLSEEGFGSGMMFLRVGNPNHCRGGNRHIKKHSSFEAWHQRR